MKRVQTFYKRHHKAPDLSNQVVSSTLLHMIAFVKADQIQGNLSRANESKAISGYFWYHGEQN